MNNQRHIARLKPKHPSDAGLFHVLGQFSDLENHFVRYPSVSNISALRHHVPVVIANRSKEQVIRPDTRWVVTAMKDTQAVCDRAVVNQPTDTVGELVPKRATHPAVSFWKFRGGPNPAAVRFVNLGPKPAKEPLGEGLMGDSFGGSFNVHSKFCLLCRAPGRFYGAGAFSSPTLSRANH